MLVERKHLALGVVKLTQARQAAGTEAILTRPLSVVVEVEPLGEALPSVV